MQHTQTDAAPKLLELPLEIKADAITGTFEGYGAVFGNRDRDGDIVARGAFTESLRAGMPALLWQHDQKAPVGRFDEVREDDKGLFVKGRLSMIGRGAEAYELLKMGALDGLSIGFVTKEASRDPASATRTITKADLMEISLVTFPANELARVASVKAASFDKKDTNMPTTDVNDARGFERLLRENGFSRTRAKAITAKGFKAADFAFGEDADIAEMVQALKERQLVLETRSKDMGKNAIAVQAEAIAEALSIIYKAYRRVSGSAQPIRLRVGQTKVFELGLKNSFNPKVRVEMPSPGFHHFTCNLAYWKWTSNGPREASQQLFFDGRQANMSTTLRTGKPTDSKNFFIRTYKRDGLDGVLGVLEDFIAQPILKSDITYDKFFLEDPKVARGMEKQAQAFRVIAS